jgi:hypothetical protein
MRERRRKTQANGRRTVLVLVASLLFPAAFTECYVMAAPISRPIPDNGGPTRVYVAMGLMDIDEIDSAGQNFTANLFMEARWHDPRLAHDGPGELVSPVDDVWWPQLQFVNQQKIWPTLPEVVHIAANGEVYYRQRVWGPFSQPLDVREFPFDTQDFEIRVACVNTGTDEVVLEADPETPSGLATEFSLPDWEVVGWKLDFSPYKPLGTRMGVASFALVLTAHRQASHYVLKIILPLILIVAMSWIVFWIDPNETGTQIGVATTSMLTLIAYRFMVGEMTPTVPYLTRMDFFILGSTILVFVALIQAVVTSVMAAKGNIRAARRVDLWSRAAGPAAFVIIFVWSLII